MLVFGGTKWLKLADVSVRAPICISLNRGIDDRAVASAAAEITAKLVVELVLRPDVIPVIAFEQRHDEPGCAIAALRPMPLDHVPLHRMQFRVRLCAPINFEF